MDQDQSRTGIVSMGGVLHMPKVDFGGWNFKLLWNGKAMIEWTEREDGDQEISINTPERAAEILHLMAREANAACRVYGYEQGECPDLDELKTYRQYAATPWELRRAIACIDTAIMYGEQRDYKPEESDMIDIDTIELKKN